MAKHPVDGAGNQTKQVTANVGTPNPTAAEGLQSLGSITFAKPNTNATAINTWATFVGGNDGAITNGPCANVTANARIFVDSRPAQATGGDLSGKVNKIEIYHGGYYANTANIQIRQKGGAILNIGHNEGKAVNTHLTFSGFDGTDILQANVIVTVNTAGFIRPGATGLTVVNKGNFPNVPATVGYVAANATGAGANAVFTIRLAEEYQVGALAPANGFAIIGGSSNLSCDKPANPTAAGATNVFFSNTNTTTFSAPNRVKMGGRANRVHTETIVAMGSMQPNDSAAANTVYTDAAGN